MTDAKTQLTPMNYRFIPIRHVPSLLAAFSTVLLFLLSLQLHPIDLTHLLLSNTQAPSSHTIATFISNIAKTCATPTTLSTYGRSARGRPLYILHIGNKHKPNRTIFVTSGMHGREFQAPLATLLAIHTLCSNPTNINLNLIVAPLVNPDGYERARTETPTARKTWPITTHPCTTQKTDGVDLNRNFPSLWLPSNEDDCSVTYSGETALSEPESQSLAVLLQNHRTSIFAHLDVHSFGAILFHGRANGVGGNPNALKLQQYLAEKVRHQLGHQYMSWDASIDPISRARREIRGTLMDFSTDLGVACVVMELAPKWSMKNRANGFFEGKNMAPQRAEEVVTALNVFLESARNHL